MQKWVVFREPLHESMVPLACGFVRNQGTDSKMGSLPIERRQHRVLPNPQAPSRRAAKGPSAALRHLKMATAIPCAPRLASGHLAVPQRQYRFV